MYIRSVMGRKVIRLILIVSYLQQGLFTLELREALISFFLSRCLFDILVHALLWSALRTKAFETGMQLVTCFPDHLKLIH